MSTNRFSRMIAALVLVLMPGLALADPSPGCGKEQLASGGHTMLDQDLQRHYRVHVPASHDPDTPASLMLWFHGWGGDESEILQYSQVRKMADEHAMVVVAPRGLGSGPPDNSYNSWSFSGSNSGLDGDGMNPDVSGDSAAICDDSITPDYRYPSCASAAANSCAWTHCQADDVEFALALLEKVSQELCIDSDRVFASGGSNGGMLAWTLGQGPKSSTGFRAIAPVIGLPHRGYLAGPGKASQMPVLLVTGILDDTVPPGGWEDDAFTTTSNDSDRFYYTGASAITRVWAAAHQCDVSVPAEQFDVGIEQAECRSYCDSPGKWPVVLDCRAIMGHDYGLRWSFGLVLDFFEAHSAP